MKKARNSFVSSLLGAAMVLTGGFTGAAILAQPVGALPVPTTFAADPGSLCQLPDDPPNSPSGTIQQDTYTCCPGGMTTGSTCLYAKYVNPLIQLLSALVGLAVVISIIFGGIQYVTSAGDPQRAEAGKKRIVESLVGLAAFMLLYAFLQYITPGGILNVH